MPSPSDPGSCRVARRAPRLLLLLLCATALVLCSAPVTGAPSSVRLAVPEQLPSWALGHERALQDFFDRHAGSFRTRPGIDRLLLTRETRLAGTHHARMQQTYRDLPVLGADCTVSLGADGDVRLVLGTFVPDVSVDVTPRLSEAAARAAALAHLPGAPTDYDVAARLAILRHEGRDRLVYEVRASARRRPFSRQLLVDADTGALLEQIDLTLNVTGTGCMYRLNPDTLSLETVPFPRLCCEGMRLNGSCSEVHNADPVAVPDAFSPTSTFCFAPAAPDTTNFDQANVYWHIDHLVGDVFGSFGYPGPRSPFHVTVSPGAAPGSSPGTTSLVWDVPSIWFGSIQITLRDGSRPVRDGAKEASIIYHEAAHAVMGDIGIKPGMEPEAATIHEGTADYFAAAVTGTPALGPWTYGTGGATRQDTDPAVYNYGNPNVRVSNMYIAGQIWSGALWDMRKDPAMGPVTDEIVFRALYYMPSHPSFATAATAVFQADCDIRGGADTVVIKRILAARGIPMGGGLTLTIQGPDRIAGADANVCGSWWVRPTGGLRPYSYQWRQFVRYPGYWSWQTIGSDSVVTACGPDDFDLWVVLTNARGDTVSAYRSVAVVDTTRGSLRVLLTGPSTLAAGVAGTFTAFPVGAVGDKYFYWWKTYVGRPSTGLGSVPNGCANGGCWVQVWDDTSFVLNVRVTDSVGNVATAAETVTVAGNTSLVASIEGPDTLFLGGECRSYRARVSGGRQPYRYEWHQFERYPGDYFWHDVGADSVVQVCGRSEFDLWLAVTDVQGRKISAYRTIAFADTSPPPILVSLGGPTTLGAGVAGTFTAIASGGRGARTFDWWKSYISQPGVVVGSTCRGVSSDTCVVQVSDETWFSLHVRVTDGTRSAQAAQPVSVVVDPLRVVITGDTLLDLGATGHYAAGVTGGRPPYRYAWQDSRCGGSRNAAAQNAGDFEVATETADCGCGTVMARVTASDADGRIATDTLRVAVSCAQAPLTFTVTGGWPGSAAAARVTLAVRTPRPTSADLGIYDIGGRRVAALYRGDLPPGDHVFVWSPGGVPSGIYFARLGTSERTFSRRIVLVR